ncbi:hypothetical protein [Rossellomorea sp. BNER]|uniref:hypothetical protein n=1 Tax=Rossellomorea sp. BNER TaxID=2962031 RepID=UPI003AF23E19|nr:hypothetical protein [Rossellomorea sp. BNER]
MKGIGSMGLLFETVKHRHETKRKLILGELLRKGITRSKSGQDLSELSYYELQDEEALHHVKLKE